jgi:hypothetical protein
MPYSSTNLDSLYHQFKDEGHCPKALGTYHFYHRIDGKLVAVGVYDITRHYFRTAYFIYDPDFMFLNLGVVGAIREIEFCRKIKKQHNQDLTWYLLGEMVPDCPKINYKCNYQPGTILCPRTKQHVPHDKCKQKMLDYKNLNSSEKAKLPYLQLSDEAVTSNIDEKKLRSLLSMARFLHEDTQWIPIMALNKAAQPAIIELLFQIVKATSA